MSNSVHRSLSTVFVIRSSWEIWILIAYNGKLLTSFNSSDIYNLYFQNNLLATVWRVASGCARVKEGHGLYPGKSGSPDMWGGHGSRWIWVTIN